ncbi:helix-turn-helix transcriptional regulator [Clostridium sp. cel8]|jgi:AraC-like DNA-binding protein|uniref:AraC family transcriptional regulator n=1 Tax=unclassified Clostridium TaxID=2614128 RepID=UPI0015F60DB1|nr:AraC family transcriptional regulator [Clostridium sp. cel8]MBA5851152.1 helix-turn-helix transcriptional regulator [Clostridium sp. cel8]
MKNKILKTKRGYLKHDFEIFHLKDKIDLHFELHYHSFNKIVIFLHGNVTYLIEGRAYKLQPWDILLVNNNDIHRAVIDSKEIYERIILWINPDFLIKNSINCNLLSCFNLASKQKFNLLRLTGSNLIRIKNLVLNIENTIKYKEFGSEVLKFSLLLEFIVHINRMFLNQKNIEKLYNSNNIIYDKIITKVLEYINDNLDENLSIESLSSKFYVSKYYLMHKFKKQTGYTIHNYILRKRLIKSNILIKNGENITNASIKSGFHDYSSFVRAYKKMFGVSPKKYTIKKIKKV